MNPNVPVKFNHERLEAQKWVSGVAEKKSTDQKLESPVFSLFKRGSLVPILFSRTLPLSAPLLFLCSLLSGQLTLVATCTGIG